MPDRDDVSRHVAIDQVTPGMTTAADVHDAGGALLLPAGHELTVAVLASLRECGIRALPIRPPDDKTATEQSREQRLRHLFRHNSDNPEAAELLQMLHAFNERGQQR